MRFAYVRKLAAAGALRAQRTASNAALRSLGALQTSRGMSTKGDDYLQENDNLSEDISSMASEVYGNTGESEIVDGNVEAQQWIDAMRELRKKWAPDGKFDPNRAFAPEGMENDFDFWAAAEAEAAIKRRQEVSAILDGTARVTNPTAFSKTQLEEAEAVADQPLPPKYDVWMNMLVNHVMRHGEKDKAYKTLNRALYLVYLKLRKDPVKLLMDTLDRMAPLAQIHRIGDGGARVEDLPVPYSATKRIGVAWKWVIEASQRRASPDFAVRLSEEILSAIAGKSPGFEKSAAIHKLAVANRSVATEVQQGKWKR